MKQQMIMTMLNATAEIAQMDKSNIQIYIVDLPAKQIAEWGKILPNPDEEADWYASIPDHIKQRMAALLT